MKLLIISTAPLIYDNKEVFAYSPYVDELVIFNKYVDEISFCCPTWDTDKGLLVSKIPFFFKKHFKLIDSNLNSFTSVLKSVFQSIYNGVILVKAIRKADHIHLRCPGNITLIASIIQIFFPNKIKTAKYAGNWDPKSKQPWSYRLQKQILNNTALTRNMKVLVYGEWEYQSKNIKSFFTATYSNSEIEKIQKTSINSSLNFIFTGSLVKGKNPLYALILIKELIKKNNKTVFNIYGEGPERKKIENYIISNDLNENVFLHGNQNKEILKDAYKKSHFVILPSNSEGWPKSIAEGMFWGCVPLATKVSCIPFMLDHGNRGILMEMDIQKDLKQIHNLLVNEKDYTAQSTLAASWSQKYTTNVFEDEIKKILNENCTNY